MNLTTKIAGITCKNPIWVASGTVRYGEELADFVDLDTIGAIVTKTVTLNPRAGNPPPRLVETASGMLNSIGLENGGVKAFKHEHYERLQQIDTNIIINIAGNSKADFVKCAEILTENNFPAALELNLSCPNVSHGSILKYRLMAQDPKLTEKIVTAVKKVTNIPIIVKLTPNVTDIAEIAMAAEAGGADAISLVNTYIGMAVNAETMKPELGKVIGGLSGPAIKPMALRAVWETAPFVKIPIIGIGGIMTGTDVAEFMLCGASAVQVGTANLINPNAYTRILQEFEDYLQRHEIANAADLVGGLKT